MAVPSPNRYSNPNPMWFELPPTSSGFFCGPRATFTLNFVKIVKSNLCAILLTNKRTN